MSTTYVNTEMAVVDSNGNTTVVYPKTYSKNTVVEENENEYLLENDLDTSQKFAEKVGDDIKDIYNKIGSGMPVDIELTQAEYEALGPEKYTNNTNYFINDNPGSAADAEEINYDDTTTQLGASNVQEAIEKIAQGGGTSIIEITQENYDLLTPEEKESGCYLITNAGELGTATMIDYSNTVSGLTSTNVQGAIDELNQTLTEKTEPIKTIHKETHTSTYDEKVVSHQINRLVIVDFQLYNSLPANTWVDINLPVSLPYANSDSDHFSTAFINGSTNIVHVQVTSNRLRLESYVQMDASLIRGQIVYTTR